MTFDELLLHLLKRGVSYIVIGGVACALNGFVRATEDVDIIIEPSVRNIELMLETLRKWGEGFAGELKAEDFTMTPGAIRIIEDFPLDVFTVINGKTYNDFISLTKKNSDGITYLNEEALIELKKDTRREKDAIDVLALTRILKEKEGR